MEKKTGKLEEGGAKFCPDCKGSGHTVQHVVVLGAITEVMVRHCLTCGGSGFVEPEGDEEEKNNVA